MFIMLNGVFMSHFQELQFQIDGLSLKEIKELQSYLDDKIKHSQTANKPKIKWKDIRGLAPDLLDGEDAQAWVNRMRS
jgi:hypothetical protein